MGFADIVKDARKFAVMVRVQGPDPKGLKMRKHAFHLYNSGQTTLSASGMLVPVPSVSNSMTKNLESGNHEECLSDDVLVLTVASVIEPFLSQQDRENGSKDKPQLILGVKIDVLIEGKIEVEHGHNLVEKKHPCWLPLELVRMVNIQPSSTALQSLIGASSGSLENEWGVGWSLASYGNGSLPVNETVWTENSRPILESGSQSSMAKSITSIAVLRVCSKVLLDTCKLDASIPKERGDILLAVGSPFGVLSPMHFFNSITLGSIANVYPPNSSERSFLMVDIRCLPGMEGSPVFGEKGHVIGILARPLRQRASNVEIQLVIPWEAIASSCCDLLQKVPHIMSKGLQHDKEKLKFLRETPDKVLSLNGLSNNVKHMPSPVEKAMASICLITVDGSWASGILLNKQGLVLTSAHLLEPWRFRNAVVHGKEREVKSVCNSVPAEASSHEKFQCHDTEQNSLLTGLRSRHIFNDNDYQRTSFNLASINKKSMRIRLDFMDPWAWTDAIVLYVSRGPLDIALLQLKFVPEQLSPIVMDFKCPLPGSKAYIIGHGLFGPRCNLLPSACIGVIAKVVDAEYPLPHPFSEEPDGGRYLPAMIQTTAAVHPGGSGGAVVNSEGHMIGLVTSNARHGGGTVIPHLNFSIPCAALAPVFKFSTDMQDSSLLEDLDKPNEQLSSVWALTPPLASKPRPTLLNTPPILQRNNDKEAKGSRFSKFIAETQKSRGSAHLDETEVLPNRFTPSKL